MSRGRHHLFGAQYLQDAFVLVALGPTTMPIRRHRSPPINAPALTPVFRPPLHPSPRRRACRHLKLNRFTIGGDTGINPTPLHARYLCQRCGCSGGHMAKAPRSINLNRD